MYIQICHSCQAHKWVDGGGFHVLTYLYAVRKKFKLWNSEKWNRLSSGWHANSLFFELFLLPKYARQIPSSLIQLCYRTVPVFIAWKVRPFQLSSYSVTQISTIPKLRWNPTACSTNKATWKLLEASSRLTFVLLKPHSELLLHSCYPRSLHRSVHSENSPIFHVFPLCWYSLKFHSHRTPSLRIFLNRASQCFICLSFGHNPFSSGATPKSRFT